jgi:hypothetical protein
MSEREELKELHIYGQCVLDYYKKCDELTMELLRRKNAPDMYDDILTNNSGCLKCPSCGAHITEAQRKGFISARKMLKEQRVKSPFRARTICSCCKNEMEVALK